MYRYGRTKRTRIRKQTREVGIVVSTEFISLCKWKKVESKKHGIRWKCHVCPAHFSDTGRGMMTKSCLFPGDLLVSIPRPLLITVETVLSSEIGEQVKCQNVIKFTRQQLLSLFLLQEKNKGSNSFWHPYISVLPKTLETFGHFSPREMTLFPPKLQIAVQSRMADMKQAYMEVRNFWSGEEIEYSEFLWAWFCVNSRSVFYRSAGSEFVREDGNHLALAPYLDLLNHSVGAKVEAGYNQESGCYEIHTGDTYRKHSQVFISYGNHDNYHLLVEYGFTLPDNPNDVFQVEYDDVLNAALSLSVDYMEKKKEIIQQQSFHRHWTTEESLNAGIGKTEELLNAGIGKTEVAQCRHWKTEESLNAGIGKTEETLNAGIGRLKSLNAGIGKTEESLNAGIGRLMSRSMQAVDD